MQLANTADPRSRQSTATLIRTTDGTIALLNLHAQIEGLERQAVLGRLATSRRVDLVELLALRGHLRGQIVDYERATGDRERVRDARRTGEEYLLARNLFRRLSTGEPVAPWTSYFTYPLRWKYSVLNAADYFRAASLHDGTVPDERMAEAIEQIRDARQPDGRWLTAARHPGRVWFEVDVPAGEPSAVVP